ncbi:hypothetical protein Hanom_Chr06g00507941 [Helianthus anomalus]
MRFGGKMSWVISFHADPVLRNPTQCFRTIYMYLFEDPFCLVHHYDLMSLSFSLDMKKP